MMSQVGICLRVSLQIWCKQGVPHLSFLPRSRWGRSQVNPGVTPVPGSRCHPKSKCHPNSQPLLPAGARSAEDQILVPTVTPPGHPMAVGLTSSSSSPSSSSSSGCKSVGLEGREGEKKHELGRASVKMSPRAPPGRRRSWSHLDQPDEQDQSRT